MQETGVRFPDREATCPLGFPRGSAGKESACEAGGLSLIPGLGRFPWRRERLPTPVFWPGEFHGVAKSWTRLSHFHFTQCEPVSPKEIQEGKNTCYLAAIRLQPLPMLSPEETQDVKTQDTGPT